MTAPEPALSAGIRAALCAAACALLALVAWAPAIARGGFAFDDAEALHGNPVVAGGAHWLEAFRRDYWDHVSPAGHYRPLAALSLRADWAVHGPASPAGWHATNVALHAWIVWLLAAGLWLLRGGDRTWPWLGVGLFAVHPALADSVAWISGRTSLLCAASGLAGAVALLAVQRFADRLGALARLALCGLLPTLGLAGALLSKEDGIAFAPLYALLALRSGRLERAALGCGIASAVGSYLWLRAAALGSPLPEAIGAPLAGVPLGARLLVAGRSLLELARIAAFPAGYPPNYDRSEMLEPPGPGTAGSWYLLAALGWLPWLALLTCGLRATVRGASRLEGASALLGAAALVPVLQIVPAGAVLAPRFLYVPLLLWAPLTQALWERMAPPLARRAAWAVLALCVAACWERIGVYADRESYHRAVLAHRPGDAPAWNELGLALEERGAAAAARDAYARAIELDPEYSRPWSNLGRLALESGQMLAAERSLRRAAELGPRNAVAQLNLGAFLVRQGRPEEALEPYRRALEIAPRLGGAWRGLGRSLSALERPEAAQAALERALAIDPSDEIARRALADLRAR